MLSAVKQHRDCEQVLTDVKPIGIVTRSSDVVVGGGIINVEFYLRST
jgi:hypothetical protein